MYGWTCTRVESYRVSCCCANSSCCGIFAGTKTSSASKTSWVRFNAIFARAVCLPPRGPGTLQPNRTRAHYDMRLAFNSYRRRHTMGREPEWTKQVQRHIHHHRPHGHRSSSHHPLFPGAFTYHGIVDRAPGVNAHAYKHGKRTHTHAILVNDLPCEKTAANFG